MSEANVALIRRLYEAMQARDVDAATELMHPHVVWISDERVGERPIEGRLAVIGFFTEREQMFDQLAVDPERFLDAGDRVLVYLRISGRGRASGAAFEIRIAHLWTASEGLAVRGEGFGDRDAALASAGLAI